MDAYLQSAYRLALASSPYPCRDLHNVLSEFACLHLCRGARDILLPFPYRCILFPLNGNDSPEPGCYDLEYLQAPQSLWYTLLLAGKVTIPT